MRELRGSFSFNDNRGRAGGGVAVWGRRNYHDGARGALWGLFVKRGLKWAREILKDEL